MAYNKKNWQDNVSDVTAAELNRMEQGIYDNSLVVDAVTNTLNPTDTETYKTAELTEGQITDVIGVNDIVIKGQTSQDGEPTPDSPVDVNVVSGSNVINIREGKINKNNIIHVYSQSNLTSFVSNPRATSTYFECKPNTTYKILRSEIIQRGNFKITSSPALEGAYTNFVNGANVTEVSITSGNQDKYVVIYYHWEGDSEASSDEVLDTLSAYELPGKELPLDLPVKNLCTTYNFVNATILNDGQIYEGTDRFATDYIKVKGNTQYCLNFKDGSNINFYGVAYYDTNKTFISRNTKNGGNNLTFTTDSNTVYIRVFGQPQIGTIFTEESFNTYEIQLEEGSKANAYTPYGTDPIELCKIGNYQDYFYKSGSKWYLHKEIEKKVLDGSENWQLANSGTSNYYYYYNLGHTTIQSSSIASTHYLYAFISNSNTEQGILVLADGNIRIRYGTENTVANFKTWLATNNVSVYYPLATATDTEITGTLKEQLEAIYNAPLYEQTNITQTNNDLPMILDITACKDNINGIKAFIRK